MKLGYQTPEIEVLYLYVAEVITTSNQGLNGIDGADNDDNELQWGELWD